MDFTQTPFIVIWETTQACDLACVHCRAQAQPSPLPGELTFEEGCDLLDQVAELGARIMVLSGGDPLKRADLPELIRHGKRLGLRVGTIPAATPRLTREAVARLAEAGIDQLALSLDFSTAEAHDAFRGVPGAFAKVMEAAEWICRAGVPLQINTVLTAGNFHEIDRLIELVQRLGIVFWEVFLLVPVGRGSMVEGLTAAQCELAFAKLYKLSRQAPFVIKVTEGMHYRRYVAQQHAAASHAAPPQHSTRRPSPAVSRSHPDGSIGVSVRTVNAGNGHVFISSVGEVCPSGFLPVSVGNIRDATLSELYRNARLMRQLRDPHSLKGRCGRCEFRGVCGGSRARAFAITGDPFAEDPYCAYQPSLPAPSSVTNGHLARHLS